MGQGSGIGVLDKAVAVLRAAAAAPCALSELCERTGLPRATAHRLAVGLEAHRLLHRDTDGRWSPGPALGELAHGHRDPLLEAAEEILPRLRDATGESVQLYRREDDVRVCVAAAEPASGLRDTVPVGVRLPLDAGSGAKVLVAWDEGAWDEGAGEEGAGDEAAGDEGSGAAPAGFAPGVLDAVRRCGWAESVAEREVGVASVSVPVRSAAGAVVAAVSVSGPAARIGARPGEAWARSLRSAAAALSAAIEPSPGAS